MKIFVAVIAVAIIIGGFVGAELMDSSFSITGAVVGGIGTFVVLLGLGAFFDAQERKRKEEDLPPEVIDFFDHMLGKNISPRQSQPKLAKSLNVTSPTTKSSADIEELYFSTIYGLISLQLIPKYSSPKEAISIFMTNKIASGYLLGFHDSLLQRLGLYNPGNKEYSTKLMEKSYKKLFGDQDGCTIFSLSLNLQGDTVFSNSRMNGGNDIVRYIEEKNPPFGLNRIIILHMQG